MLQRDRLTQKSGDYYRDECGQAGTCQRLDHARQKPVNGRSYLEIQENSITMQ